MHAVSEPLLGLVVAVLKAVIAFTVGIFAITFGFKVFGRLTKHVDLLEELKRGNLAVGVLVAAVILAYTNVIGSGLDQVTDGVLTPGATLAQRGLSLVGGVANLALAVTVASLTIRYALLAFEKITRQLNPETELKARNVAVAFMLAGIIFGLSQVTSRGVNEIGSGIGQVLIGVFT